MLLPLLFLSCEREVGEKEVPSIVVNTFKTNYPEAGNVEWKKSYDIYEVVFKIEEVNHEVRINSLGKIEQSKYEISYSHLPKAVKRSVLALDIKGIDEVELVKVGNDIYYQVDLMDDRKLIDTMGNIIYKYEYWD